MEGDRPLTVTTYQEIAVHLSKRNNGIVVIFH